MPFAADSEAHDHFRKSKRSLVAFAVVSALTAMLLTLPWEALSSGGDRVAGFKDNGSTEPGTGLQEDGKASAQAAPTDLPSCPTDEESPDVRLLLKRVEFTLDGTSSVGTVTMSIRTPSWSRKLKMKIWSKGRDYALVRILEGGPNETGMMTLKRGKQLWNYLPKAERVMKLPSGMLGDSWMGSDFTNDDLVRGTSLSNDFNSKVVGTAEHDGRKAWKVELIPKDSAKVVWGKIEMVLDRETCVPLVERFYDEDGSMTRLMTFADIRQVGWRQFPARMTVKPSESGRETVFTYEKIEFDIPVSDDTFSLHRLQQGR